MSYKTNISECVILDLIMIFLLVYCLWNLCTVNFFFSPSTSSSSSLALLLFFSIPFISHSFGFVFFFRFQWWLWIGLLTITSLLRSTCIHIVCIFPPSLSLISAFGYWFLFARTAAHSFISSCVDFMKFHCSYESERLVFNTCFLARDCARSRARAHPPVG